ncbi:MAG: transglutaminase family protein [Anaerolineae bacterium]|nr:transglutaminase family protein [Anaerolineae bacterium]
MTHDEWRSEFERVIALPEAEIDLAEGALIVAGDEYPDLAVEYYLARVDEMAGVLQRRITEARDAHEVIGALNTYLFDELGFYGNVNDYYDPRNSYLNEVLDRRTGLPITLCVVVLALARRLGLPIFGVGLPGHFVVKWQDTENEIVFDPFNGGEILDRNGVRARVRETVHPLAPFQASWLDAVGPKYILGRMLQNLKAVLVRAEELERARFVVDKLLLLNPRAGEEIRDLGLLSLKLGAHRQAAVLLEQYLLAHGDAADAPLMRVYLKRALEQVERLN